MNNNNNSNSGPVLNATGVVKSYGARKALDAVDITIQPGEFVVLLGPNGAGKTTLFQLLTGLFTPDAGEIYIGGIDIRNNPVPALAGIGVVFQQPTLDLDLSVTDNLRFHASLHGLNRTEARLRIDEELGKLKLTDRFNDRARTLSGGQRRRIELARALLHRPQFLIMDEPTVGLDPSSRRDLLSYVLQLKRERQMAILWASHLVDEAEQADRVIILHKGQILTAGEPEKLVQQTGSNNLHDAFVSITKEN
ncbi:MAG TPA: ATP-binding cassette domain-containing protein [Alphaproteobacteria bacterium]|nr:ATP-binding cassette domain-containing protein [Alphaproteobacteria bacterium]